MLDYCTLYKNLLTIFHEETLKEINGFNVYFILFIYLFLLSPLSQPISVNNKFVY